MYTPRFTITPKITQDIEKIGVVFGYFRAVQLPENYRRELVSKVAVETVHASTAIEGNTLTQKQVGEVLSGIPVTAQEKEIKEVENYNKALVSIEKFGRQKGFKVGEQTVKGIHATLLKDIDNEIAGKYRTRQVYVGDYMPPEHYKVPTLVQELVSWINNPNPENLSPILLAGIAHYQSVAIHPFEDGNGRITRLLTTLILIQNDYDMVSFFAPESFYNRNRKAYYEALSSADKYGVRGQPDLTRWLEYFVSGMLIEAERAKSRIEEMLQKKSTFGRQDYISDNQRKILKLATQKGTIKTADVLQLTGLSRKGAYNAVEKLVHIRLLESVGVGKGTYYKITDKGLEYVR
ncbi:Fic family protein [Candidatus Curtissbacteria bacterium]|nr:Fic family protein [Candidatus Curtissbacteria bacterium]